MTVAETASRTRTVAVLEPGYADYAVERGVLAGHGVRVAPIGPEEDAVSALRALDPVAILTRERVVRTPEIESAPNLKVVVRYGVGVDNIDLAEAARRRIYVANVPDYGAEHEVSEHAVALYLAVQRRIVSRDAEVRAGRWGVGQAAPIPGRVGATLGLIGCGRIGLQAARKWRRMISCRAASRTAASSVIAAPTMLTPMSVGERYASSRITRDSSDCRIGNAATSRL